MSRTFHRFRVVPAILLAGWAAWGMLDSAFGQPPASHPAGADQSPERERAGQVTTAVADDFDLDAYIQSLNPPTVEEIIKSLEPIPTLEECLAPLPDDPNLPFRRVLDDKDMSRVGELAARIEKHREQGNFLGAIPLGEEMLAIRQRVQGTGHWQTGDAQRQVEMLRYLSNLPPEGQAELSQADALEVENSRLYEKGDFAGSAKISIRQLQIRRHLLGEAHWLTAYSLDDLGVILHAGGRDRTAEPLIRSGLVRSWQVLGRCHPQVARNLNNLAGLLNSRGDYDAAAALARETLQMHRLLLGDNDSNVAVALNTLASALENGGDYAGAEPVYREALAMNVRLRPEHADTAIYLDNLGRLLKKRGDYVGAEPFLREALVMRRRLLGDRHPAVARSLNNLAELLVARCEDRLAEPLHREALAIRREVFGAEHPDVATSLNNLGQLLQRRGDGVAAEGLLNEALEIRRKVLGAEHPRVATSIHNLASLLAFRSDYAGAQRLEQEALAMHRRLLGEEHEAVATDLHNLAVLRTNQGDRAGAEALYHEVLALDRRLLGDAHPYVADTTKALGTLRSMEGDYAGAEVLWTEAARIFEVARSRVSTAGLERTAFGAELSPLERLAAVLARNGKPAAAWERREQDLGRGLLDMVSARASRPLTPEERGRQEDLIVQLGRLDEQLFSPPGTKAPSDGSQSIARELHTRRDELQTELARFEKDLEDKYGVAAGQVYRLDVIQAYLPADAALLVWADVKGDPRAVDPNGEHWACLVRHGGEPVWVKLPGSGAGGAWTEDDDKLPQQVRAALSQRSRGEPAEWRHLVDRLYAQRLAPVVEQLNGGAGAAPVKHVIILPAGWMAGVPVEALTDEYTVSYAPSGTMYAWLTERRHEGTQAHKDEGVGTLLALGDPVFAQPEAVAEATPEVPDHGVLIAMVLPDSNAGRSGLKAGDVLVSYAAQELGSAAELGPAIQKAATAGTTRGDEAIPVRVWREGQTLELAVAPGKLGVQASPQPPAEALAAKRRLDAALTGTRGASLAPLPGSRCEVDAIATLFKQAPGAAESTVLLGSDASEQRLDELAATGELQKFRFLHLATHAVMDDQVAMRSALILSQDRLPDALQQVLAGKKVWDGRLTADQIVRTWKLDAELVTLSACQTALGKASGGEGYLGFAQALFVAGAHSLVLSLWKVDDTATALLMQRFYENLLVGRAGVSPAGHRGTAARRYEGEEPLAATSKAEALREAKSWLRHLTAEEVSVLTAQLPGGEVRGTVREKPAAEELPAGDHPYASPYYWAAFILVGDPG
jgi:CHAT domain-containing protein/tetratricopeptide (TPR) repeat protein